MTVQFSDRFYDYVELVWANSKWLRFWVILSRVVFFAPLMVLAWINPSHFDLADFYLTPGTLVIGFAAFAGKYYWAWQTWRNRASSEDQTICEFSEKELRSKTQNTDVTLLWEDISAYQETRLLFLLGLPNGRYFFIPKRAFTDNTQQQTFRNLISRSLKNESSTTPTLAEFSVGVSGSKPFQLALTDCLELYNGIASSIRRISIIIVRALLAAYVFWRIYNLSESVSYYLAIAETVENPLRRLVGLLLIFFVELIWIVPVIWFAFSNYIYAFLQYRKQPKFQQVEINDEGVNIQAGTISNSLKWEYLSKFIETKNLFLLCTQSRGTFAVPKRAFSGELQQQFRAVLTQKLNQSQ